MATGLDTEKANSAIKEGYAALERFGSQRARNWTIAIVAIVALLYLGGQISDKLSIIGSAI